MKQAAQILSEILNERQATNPSYSLRAFARDLGISAPQLSNVMSGNRGLSPKMAAKISGRLTLSSVEKVWFHESLKLRFSRSKSQRTAAAQALEEIDEGFEEKHLSLDLFKVISTWHHLALLELIKISKPNHQPAYFARRLGIPESEVLLSLERLRKLALITRLKAGFSVNQDTVIADQGIPTEAVRNYHKQMLGKAIQAVAFQKSEDRYGYSGAMPMRVKNVERAKKLIKKFKSDFAKELSDEESGEEIFGFSFQIFKLSKETETQV